MAAHAQKRAQSQVAPDGGVLQRKCDMCRKKDRALQRSAFGSAPETVPLVVHEVLRSPGQPLNRETRAFFEPRFSHNFSSNKVRNHQIIPDIPQSQFILGQPMDHYEKEADRVANAIIEPPAPYAMNLLMHPKINFSQVRIHDDARAKEAARMVNARAFAYGNDIVFGEGQYTPAVQSGRWLLAHELTHVVQQSAGIPEAQKGSFAYIARSPLDLDRLDSELFWGDPLTQTTGEIGCGATRGPRQSTPSEDCERLKINAFVYPRNTGISPAAPVGSGGTPTSGTSSQTTPTGVAGEPRPESDQSMSESAIPPFPSPRQVTGQPDRSSWRLTASGLLAPARRALVVSGIHGDERGPLDTVRQLQSELSAGTNPLANDFDTIVIPQMNPGGIVDGTRTNRRGVDLNRNFPGLRGFPNPPSGQQIPPEQPEVRAVRRVIEVLNPERILALHAISDSRKGGAYADPIEGQVARDLACRMALRMRGTSLPGGAMSGDVNVTGNRLASDVCNVRYPETASVSVTTAQSSLGSWASAPTDIGGRGIPVITHEVAGKAPLRQQGSGRSVSTIMPGIREFFLDNEHLPSEADIILRRAVSNAFLTGRGGTVADSNMRQAITQIVLDRFRDMDAYYREVWRPSQSAAVRASLPQSLTDQINPSRLPAEPVSGFRSFQSQTGIASRALGQQALFQTTSTDDEIRQAILNVMQTISIPGFSRHHWGTEIDVVSATRSRWEGNGSFMQLIPFLRDEAHRFGFFHPYSDRRPSSTLPHYQNEPWHLSYWPIANVLQQEWAQRITGTVLNNLITETAMAIHGPIDQARMEGILRGIGLENFQTNVAPSP